MFWFFTVVSSISTNCSTVKFFNLDEVFKLNRRYDIILKFSKKCKKNTIYRLIHLKEVGVVTFPKTLLFTVILWSLWSTLYKPQHRLLWKNPGKTIDEHWKDSFRPFSEPLPVVRKLSGFFWIRESLSSCVIPREIQEQPAAAALSNTLLKEYHQARSDGE